MTYFLEKIIMKITGYMSLRTRMIIGGIAAVLIPFLITGIIIYIQLSGFFIEITREKSVLVAKDISVLIDSIFSEELKTVSAIATDSVLINAISSGNYKKAKDELKLIYNRVGSSYISFFLTDKDGISRVDVFDDVRLGLDLSDREYFIHAKSGYSSVTGPILTRGPASDKNTGTPIIVVSAPVYHGKNFIGIVAATHKLEVIERRISVFRTGETGYAFITDKNGLTIVHPSEEYILKANMNDEHGMEELLYKILRKEAGAVSYKFRGTEKIAGYAPLGITGWNIVFTQNLDEIMKPVNKILFAVMIIGIIFLVITILSIIIFSKRISNPVERMLEIMKNVTANSTEMIIGIGIDRMITFANPLAQKLLRRSEKELIGTPLLLVNTAGIDPDDIWITLNSGVAWSGYIKAIFGQGDEKTISVIVVSIKDEKGSIRSYLEIGRDVTDELLLEKRMQQAQKMESIGTMAGGIAHDFNNILSGIFGYSELSLNVECNPVKTQKYIQEIMKAAVRARDLVNQILIFSRGGETELSVVSPRQIIKEIIKLLRASTPATIEIESEIFSEKAIMADPTQLHQLLVNLCTNAVHAIGIKPGKISVSLEDFYVDKEYAKSHPPVVCGEHILLTVADTGSGIKPEIIDSIFEPFFTTKPQGEGTGLGLSVVHGIVRKLNGLITVYSEASKGTVFNIIIPAVSNNVLELPDEIIIRGGSERIMLVDDEQIVVESFYRILKGLGYNVTVFKNSQEALDTFNSNPDGFDIIITDYAMPQMNGFDFVENIKIKNPDIPVIMTSGYISIMMEKKAEEYLISSLLKKPLTTSQLTNAIRKIFETEEAVKNNQ